MHFAVESRSGAVNGVLLEGPDLDSATGEGPKARNAAVEETMEVPKALIRQCFVSSEGILNIQSLGVCGADPGEEHSPKVPRFSGYQLTKSSSQRCSAAPK